MSSAFSSELSAGGKGCRVFRVEDGQLLML